MLAPTEPISDPSHSNSSYSDYQFRFWKRKTAFVASESSVAAGSSFDYVNTFVTRKPRTPKVDIEKKNEPEPKKPEQTMNKKESNKMKESEMSEVANVLYI
jgi:hypothetical protein